MGKDKDALKFAIQGATMLFLTTDQIDNIANYKAQNKVLLEDLEKQGAHVKLQPWRDPNLDSTILSSYNIITFLVCDKYNLYFKEFIQFLQDTLIPFQKEHPGVRIVNDPSIVLWNAQKS